MKIEKIIKITATAQDIETFGNFLALFEEMEEDVWDELNHNTNGHLADALATFQEVYEMIEEEND